MRYWLFFLPLALAGFWFATGPGTPMLITLAIASAALIGTLWYRHLQAERRGRMAWEVYANRALARPLPAGKRKYRLDQRHPRVFSHRPFRSMEGLHDARAQS
jgi:hypothetical protein